MADFFGFEIKRKGDDGKELPSFVPNTDDDGVGVISTGGHFGQYVDLDGDTAKNEVDLIMKYRDIASHPECDAAIEDVVNESICGDAKSAPIEIILDEVQASDKVKKAMKEEFENVVNLLHFNSYAHDICHVHNY